MVDLLNPYRLAVAFRNFLYDRNLLRTCRPPFRTISVGNLSVGGVGKTPTVMELSKFLLREGFKVAILLRGYGRKSKGPLLVSEGKGPLAGVKEAGDEAYLYAKLLNGVPVAVAERRCEGLKLLERFKIEFLLLDDAFQHRAIERDLDIVLLTPGDLRERLLPFGRLREPLSSLKRADYCLFSKTEGSLKLENLCTGLGKPFGYLKRVGLKLLLNGEREVPLTTLSGKRVGVVSALGDNGTFLNQVLELAEKYRFEVVKVLQFRDHFDYRGVRLMRNLAWITTFKDLYKLPSEGVEIFVLDRVFELPESLKKAILNLA